MDSRGNSSRLISVVAIAVIAVVVVIAALFLTPPAQSGGVGYIFYSANSNAYGYAVFATLSNNSTSAVVIERVYFDGSEQAYSMGFPADVAGIWSFRVGDQNTKTLNSSSIGSLSVRVEGVNPDTTHTMRVETNASSFEFTVVRQTPSIKLDHYGPALVTDNYVIAYLNNTGTVPAYVTEVSMDGQVYHYSSLSIPPETLCWSIAVNNVKTPIIWGGQQAMVYIDTSQVCHSCTHNVKIVDSDGSSVVFTLIFL